MIAEPGARWDVDVRHDAHPIAEAYEAFQRGVVRHRAVITEAHFGADDGVVAGLEIVADRSDYQQSRGCAKSREIVKRCVMVFDWMKTLFRQADETINEAVTIVEQTGWAVGASDQGKVRSNNEDAWFISLERQWFMVADGMGGHAAGEQASRIAIETVSAALNAVQVSAVADDRIVSLLTRVCQLTSEVVAQEAEIHHDWKGMGCTLVLALLLLLPSRGVQLPGPGHSRQSYNASFPREVC